MSINEKVFVRRFVEMFNMIDMSIADEIFAREFKAHVSSTPIPIDRLGFKSFMMGLYEGLPNLMLEIDDTITSADRLVLRGMFTGTHKHDFLDIPPTGNEVCFSVVFIFHIEGGMVVENWTFIDFLGAISQISTGTNLPTGNCD